MNVQTEAAIKVGDKWGQVVTRPDGSQQLRVIEIIAAPTLSTPVSYKIVRNDAHPHRKGKFGQIRQADLRRKYQPAVHA
ncbi:hypothetical protein [uncultured Microbacterium sp.]|uniref:hypothetical protein n=1 Tax=uncultured Microbacterium sp. TaxID=191216 RepID=UPI0025F94A58|nr:hypothetical protein [uncultured Microbacterium sp.]